MGLHYQPAWLLTEQTNYVWIQGIEARSSFYFKSQSSHWVDGRLHCSIRFAKKLTFLIHICSRLVFTNWWLLSILQWWWVTAGTGACSQQLSEMLHTKSQLPLHKMLFSCRHVKNRTHYSLWLVLPCAYVQVLVYHTMEVVMCHLTTEKMG